MAELTEMTEGAFRAAWDFAESNDQKAALAAADAVCREIAELRGAVGSLTSAIDDIRDALRMTRQTGDYSRS